MPAFNVANRPNLPPVSPGVARPVHPLAHALRMQGMNRDNHLVHINPQEMQTLQALHGPSGINPMTGLPQFDVGEQSGTVNETGTSNYPGQTPNAQQPPRAPAPSMFGNRTMMLGAPRFNSPMMYGLGGAPNRG